MERTCVTYIRAIKLYSVVALLLACFEAWGQNKAEVDSLLRVVETTRDAKTKMRAEVQLGWHFLDNDDGKALAFSTRGLELAWQFGDSASIVKAARVKAHSLRKLNRPNEAIQLYTQVLPIAARNNIIEEQKKILNGLAVTYTFLAIYDKALDYHLQSLVLREAHGTKEEITVTLNNIGLVYFKMHNYESALRYYQECVALKLEINSHSYLDLIYLNMGLCYLHLRNYTEAKAYTLKGMAVCVNECSTETIMIG